MILKNIKGSDTVEMLNSKTDRKETLVSIFKLQGKFNLKLRSIAIINSYNTVIRVSLNFVDMCHYNSKSS